jgi:hypothetical protein
MGFRGVCEVASLEEGNELLEKLLDCCIAPLS